MRASEKKIREFVQKCAHRLHLEGTSIIEPHDTVKIVATGSHEAIEHFIDLLYNGFDGCKPSTIEVEPFIKDRDFRGIFRVL